MKENTKYFITIKIPNNEESSSHRVLIRNIFKNKDTGHIERITFHDLNDKVYLKNKIHFTSTPYQWIVKVESLHDVLDSIMVDDIMMLIDEYV